MKKLAERLMKRNYAKRLLACLIAAVVLFAVFAALIPLTLRRQIGELRAWNETREDGEKQEEAADGAETRKRDGKERELKAALHRLTPVGKGTKATFAAVALLAVLLGIFRWVTVAEWLYRLAVLHGLNRALWPMLGCVLNVFAFLPLLVVLYDPKRDGEAQKC